jgi:DNA-directed RNA polymerase subunit RPC12/RpoP
MKQTRPVICPVCKASFDLNEARAKLQKSDQQIQCPHCGYKFKEDYLWPDQIA